MMNKLTLVIEPRKSDLGDGFVVRRLLPYAKKRFVGPFVFWDHMGPVQLDKDKGMNVRAHPHIGLSTITYLFSGEIMHRDSLGNELPILPGEINWMVAGKWISHSERANPTEPMTLEGIQVWVALPKEHEDSEPDFSHHKPHELPLVKLGDFEMRLIAGQWEEQVSPLKVFSPMFYMHGEGKPQDQLELKLPENQEGAVYVAGGKIDIDGKIYSEGTMICFETGTLLKIRIIDNTRLMLLGGEPFDEKRHIFWNFVSSDPQKIEAAKEKWLSGRFEPVINDPETIPLPGEKRS